MRPYRALHLILFLTLFVPLLWLLVVHRGGAILVRLAPDWALAIGAASPSNLVTVVERDPILSGTREVRESERTNNGRDPADLRRMLVAAINRAPLNARAHRLLGQIAELRGDRSEAKRAMKMAARLSLNESYAVDWMMRESVSDKAYPQAADYADILLRTQPQLVSYVAPLLGRMAEADETRPAILSLLRENPPWRPAFFRFLANGAASGQTMLDLLTGLKGSTAPPTTNEVNSFLALLIRNKQYDYAYRAWLQFLPADRREAAGYLFNGSFQSEPDGSPFDWRLPNGKGLTAELAERDEGQPQRALVMRLGPGRVEIPGASQMTILPPGAYRFSGAYQGEIRGPRGLEWAVRCIEQSRPIGAGEMFSGVAEDWRSFGFEFLVPEENCPALSVTVAVAARSPSEQLVSGTIWFDDLAIERVSDE